MVFGVCWWNLCYFWKLSNISIRNHLLFSCVPWVKTYNHTTLRETQRQTKCSITCTVFRVFLYTSTSAHKRILGQISNIGGLCHITLYVCVSPWFHDTCLDTSMIDSISVGAPREPTWWIDLKLLYATISLRSRRNMLFSMICTFINVSLGLFMQ